MKDLMIIIFSLTLFTSCKTEPSQKSISELKTGFWRATLEVQDHEKLPFIFEVNDQGMIVIHNAEERIEVDEIVITGDSIRIQTPVFEGYFKGRFRDRPADKTSVEEQVETKITGAFIKPSLDRVVPFEMVYGSKERFLDTYVQRDDKPPYTNVAGSWETVFSPDSPSERYIAKGIFKQEGDIVTGTFRTTTGDYRYLEGRMIGDQLRLSTFDGAHAFLFTASVTNRGIEGIFYSGNHFQEPFKATRNDNYELPDAENLTYLKEGYDRFDFEFPDENGTTVSLTDDRFKNKVVLVQVMGTWCPNCIEESKFYRDYLEKYPNSDLEVIALAFEYTKTEAKAWESINRLKNRLTLPYPVLLAQYGQGADKKAAAKMLPMLNHILSYPTTVYIDKKGAVRRIHTGYNGTATGAKHMEFKEGFEKFVETLLAEE